MKHVYVRGVTAVAALALLGALALASPDLSGHKAALALALIALAFAAHLAPIALAPNRAILLETSVQMVALLVLPPGEAALVCALAAVLANVYGGRTWSNSIFNAAQVTLAVLSAGALYRLLAPATFAGTAALSRGLLAMIVAAVVLFLVGELVVNRAVAARRRLSPGRVWWRPHREALLTHALPAAIGIAAAPAIAAVPWLALVLMAPVAALRAALLRAHRAHEEAVRVAEAMAATVEARHPALAGVTARLATLADELARRHGFTAEERRAIVLAARLHHIGAAALPAGVRLVPDGITVEAASYRRRHPDEAAALIAAGFGLPAVAEVLRYHHESFDGLGTPHGLAGGDIPSASRILGLCEAWVSLTTPAGARPALTAPQALIVLRAGAGTQWDPSLVELLTRIVASSLEGAGIERRHRLIGASLAAAG